MKISVIIACYNAAETIGVQMEALSRQSWHYQWEVIVADNRSTDDSMRIVREYKDKLPGLKIVNAFNKQGAAYALNLGAQAAVGDALVYCDADDMVGSGWLQAMGRALTQHNFVACRMDVKQLNVNIPDDDGKGNPQETGLQQIWYPPYLPHAGAGTMGVRKYLHNAVNGFDETLPHLFDTDYCFKIQILTGEQIVFVPDGVLFVRNRQTLIGNYRQSRNYAEYNVVLFKKYRSVAKERPDLWKLYMSEWLKLVRAAPAAFFQRNKYRFAWDLGRQIGRMKACLRLRVPPV